MSEQDIGVGSGAGHEGCRDEIARLEVLTDDLHVLLDRAQAQRDAALAALRDAWVMLKNLEWSDRKPTEIVDGIQQYGEWCPWCQIESNAGHSTVVGCRLAGTIRTVEAALRAESAQPSEPLPEDVCSVCGMEEADHELVNGELQGGDDWSAHLFTTDRAALEQANGS